MRLLRLALLALVCSCATAGGNDDGDNGFPPDAATNNSFPDARPIADAAPSPDAKLTSNPDAMPAETADAGLFCEDSSTCTDQGTCCFSLGGPGFCVPGDETIPGICIPD